jgi:transcriptional regulator with XRE-family HTH domain
MAENPALEAFGDWLKEAAARAGYVGHGSTAKLARAAGLDPGQTSRFLNGGAAPSSANLPGLADAIGVTVDEMARRIAGMEIRESDVKVVDAKDSTPEQIIASLGVTEPEDQAVVLAMIERLRTREPRRDHRQRGVGGHPRPQSLKPGEQPDEPGAG